MRRSILVAVVLGALAGLATIAGISVAGSGGGSSPKTAAPGASHGSFKGTYAAKRHRGRRGHRHGHGHGMRFGPMALAFSGVADRLNVSKDELIDAVKGAKDRALDRAVAEGVISQAERDALQQCMTAHHRGGKCSNRRAARRAHRKLHRELHRRIRGDAAAMKSQLIGDLAAELGKDSDVVERALRAELSELLNMGVSLGFVTDRGRDLALGCWDRPNECDHRALRAEVRKRFGGHRHGHHRGRGRHP